MQKHFLPVLLICTTVFLLSCESGLDGTAKENIPPNTFLTLNEINLPEGERLVSQVSISWWGDDPDGYIKGYEFYIGDSDQAGDDDWTFTERTDSVFILPIPQGDMTADVEFTVRAIDNDDERDADPPNLIFPIKNTIPQVEFNNLETPPDTTYRVLSFGFTATDPDGNLNLNRVEVAVNDTSAADAWHEIPLGINLITLRIDDTSDDPAANVFLGLALNDAGFTLDGFNLDGTNEFFIRSIDNAGAVSEVASHSWYLKKQTSNILFLNDYAGTRSDEMAALHFNLLNNVGFENVDYIDISDGVASGGRRVTFSQAFPDRTLAEPTINMMLAEWDHIYWISDDLNRNIGYALEITFDFFEQGGTMFVNIPTRYLSEDNALLQFLPFQSVEPLPAGQQSFYLRRDTVVTTASDAISTTPELRLNRNVISLYPIVPLNETIELFEAPFQTRAQITGTINEFNGSKLIAATNPDESLVYFGVDFYDFTDPYPFPDPSGDAVCYDPDVPESFDEDLQRCSDLEELVEIITTEILGFE